MKELARLSTVSKRPRIFLDITGKKEQKFLRCGSDQLYTLQHTAVRIFKESFPVVQPLSPIFSTTLHEYEEHFLENVSTAFVFELYGMEGKYDRERSKNFKAPGASLGTRLDETKVHERGQVGSHLSDDVLSALCFLALCALLYFLGHNRTLAAHRCHACAHTREKRQGFYTSFFYSFHLCIIWGPSLLQLRTKRALHRHRGCTPCGPHIYATYFSSGCSRRVTHKPATHRRSGGTRAVKRTPTHYTTSHDIQCSVSFLPFFLLLPCPPTICSSYLRAYPTLKRHRSRAQSSAAAKAPFQPSMTAAERHFGQHALFSSALLRALPRFLAYCAFVLTGDRASGCNVVAETAGREDRFLRHSIMQSRF